MLKYYTSDLSPPVVVIKEKSITFKYPGKTFYESPYYIVTLSPGIYTIQCWGANGRPNGYGGYTSGKINLNQTVTFFLYLGGKSQNYRIDINGPFNGGGAGDRVGGGATDVRLFGGNWDDFHSLKTRIMVAGGGGGMDCPGNGGHGGGIEGTKYYSNAGGDGGTQINGGKGFVYGSFGKGGSQTILYNEDGSRKDFGGGGGGGYYGGGTGLTQSGGGGGGGSSFVSGHRGCNAINESSTKNNIIHTVQSIHYSGLFFTNTETISGNNTMPLPDGSNGIGYLGSGVVKISSENAIFIKNRESCIRKHIRIDILSLVITSLLCSQ